MASPAMIVRLGHDLTTAGEAAKDMGRLCVAFAVYGAAFTWTIVAVWLCLGPVAALWQSMVGGLPAIVATLGSLNVSVILARRMLHLGDRLVNGTDVTGLDGQLHVATSLISDPYDWVAYNRQNIREHRKAHYYRTQQFDRLAALEREEQEERARVGVPSLDVSVLASPDSRLWDQPMGSLLAPLRMGWHVIRVLVGRQRVVTGPGGDALESALHQAEAALATVAHVLPPPQRAAALATATDVIQWEATTPEAVGPVARRVSHDMIATGMRSHLGRLSSAGTFWHTAASPFLAAGGVVAGTMTALVVLGELSLSSITFLPLLALVTGAISGLTVATLDRRWRQP